MEKSTSFGGLSSPSTPYVTVNAAISMKDATTPPWYAGKEMLPTNRASNGR